MKMPSFSHLLLHPTIQLRHRFRIGYNRLLCVRSDSIRGQEAPGWPRFRAPFHPSVRWVRCDWSDRVVICSFHLAIPPGTPSAIPITVCAS